MTDIQLLTIVLTLLAIYGATFWTRKGVEDMRDVLRAEMRAQTAELRTDFQRVENKLDHLADTIASHSARLDKLEG